MFLLNVTCVVRKEITYTRKSILETFIQVSETLFYLKYQSKVFLKLINV